MSMPRWSAAIALLASAQLVASSVSCVYTLSAHQAVEYVRRCSSCLNGDTTDADGGDCATCNVCDSDKQCASPDCSSAEAVECGRRCSLCLNGDATDADGEDCATCN
eukprot:4181765-Prymnesium_polylepis.1